MKKILALAMIVFSGVSSAQGKFEPGMERALAMWGENKPDEAIALLERIAAAEPDQWLPNYYVGLISAVSAFQTQDGERIKLLLNRAQAAVDAETSKNPLNPELKILQALIFTGWIVADPMANGMTYSGKALEQYDSALAIDPKNPRAVFGKAEFEINRAKFFGKDIKPMCDEVVRAIKLFENSSRPTRFHPNWGLDRALEIEKECNKKR